VSELTPSYIYEPAWTLVDPIAWVKSTKDMMNSVIREQKVGINSIIAS
jgi:hypothetical protein